MNGSAELFRRASGVMPGGVSSPVRAFRAVGGTPPAIVRAEGCRLHDTDGKAYIDLVGAWGPAIIGHAHPSVVDAVARAAAQGLSHGVFGPADVALAEDILDRVPGAERVRFANSGTEAVMTALRLARAATGRPFVIRLDGCYHGHVDEMLEGAGSGVATLSSDGAGERGNGASRTPVARYNDADSVEALLRAHAGRVAAIVVEPVAGNMGVVPPAPGFLERLRALADETGALLIFDEVMTGFRVARGGAQERFGVGADLLTLGKIIGGGLPIGAVAGPAHLLDLLAPQGPVYHAGTFAGNPVVMAAGRATLAHLDEKAYRRLEAAGARLERELVAAILDNRTPAVVQRVGSMLTMHFSPTPVRSMDDARRSDHRRFAAFFHAMLARGVYLPPSGYEAWFISLAHDDTALDEVACAAREALADIASGIADGADRDRRLETIA